MAACVNVAGDFRELQGTMWAHDHRFFFTAENVYKGALGMVNYYSGPDRGNEELDDGVNLRLPSGSLLDSGNLDFDVNLIVSDAAFDRDGQYFFDIFDTDGFLGDVPLVNFAYAPFFEVLPRKYRFRILNASMSRFYQFQLADEQRQGGAVPVHRQRRQPGGEPDPADQPGSAGHRGALRHRRRLLRVSASATRCNWSTRWSRPTGACRKGQVSLASALARRAGRSDGRPDAAIPRRLAGR